MACSLLSHEVSDLILGKRSLFCLPLSASIAHALQALEQRDEPEISVWDCVDSVAEGACGWQRRRNGECHCVGKICLQKIICYLATDERLSDLPNALSQPLSALFKETSHIVKHIDSDASILEALSLIVSGVQNLVVPINSPFGKLRNSGSNANKIVQKSRSTGSSLSAIRNGKDYCWLTQEDMMRFLLGFIGLFSPLPMMSIEDLGIISNDVLMVDADQPAVSALEMIVTASRQMSAVAVVENPDGTGPKLIADISPSTLRNCDEMAPFALATLTARDFLTYIKDCKNPPEKLINEIRVKLSTKLQNRSLSKTFNLQHMVSPCKQDMESSESSDDEHADSPTGHHQLTRRWSSGRRSFNGMTLGRGRVAPMVCYPWSSLVAVLLQALAHRENYLWVLDGEGTLVGIVTFPSIARVLLDHLSSTS